MIYKIEFKPRALRDLRSIDRTQARRILDRVAAMKNDLAGEVKRLTKFTPEYRLRVGSFRVLFEIEGDKVIIYRVRHRRDAYS